MKKILPPFLVAVLSRLFFSWIAISQGQRPWTAAPWIRWDSNLYLDIARKGYEFVSCKQIGFASINDACGNTGWFPGYPIFISLSHFVLGMVSVSWETCAVLVPFVAFVLILAYVWNGFLAARISARNILVLLVVAFFPGCVYFHAAFPPAVTGVFILAMLHGLQEGGWRRAWLHGFLAGVSYPIGFLAGGMPFVYFFLKRNFRLALFVSLSGFAGFGAVLFVQRWQTGIWGTFFQVQRKYGFTERSPLISLYEDLTHFGTDGIHLQTTLISVYMLFLFGFVAWRKKMKQADVLDWTLLAGATCFWIIPHLLGGRMTSFYRGELLLFPSAIILRNAPSWILAGILLSFGAMAYLMGGLFFQNLLV